jgi:hypothetical protein
VKEIDLTSLKSLADEVMSDSKFYFKILVNQREYLDGVKRPTITVVHHPNKPTSFHGCPNKSVFQTFFVDYDGISSSSNGSIALEGLQATVKIVERFKLALDELLAKAAEVAEKEEDVPSITLKIKRHEYKITEKDEFLDNGSCIQLLTQSNEYDRWSQESTPKLSQKMAKEITRYERIPRKGRYKTRYSVFSLKLS